MYITVILIVFVCIIIYCYYRDKKRKILRDLAIDIIKVFNEYDVDYWVDFGTLLGIIREDDIILGDDDVDICIVNYPENITKVEKALKKLIVEGYGTKRMDWRAYRVYTYCFFYADIYINEFDDKRNEFVGATGETSNISYDLIGKRRYIEWFGIKVKVPEKIHETLVWRYGENFMIPQNSKGRNI